MVGRHARLELRFERRGERTILAHGYAEPPFRVGPTWHTAGTLSMIVAWSAPGLFAGDRLEGRIVIGPGASVRLVSQSALQVHPSCREERALLTSEYDVGPAAELYCHWDPLIPFARSRLEQRVVLRLAPTSRLYWSEALMTGRAARGEAWQFEELGQELRVLVQGRLDYLERYRITPHEATPTHPWAAGGACYLGTAVAHEADDRKGAAPQDREAAARALQNRLTRVGRLRAGVDLPSPGLIVARLASADGASFATARTVLGETLLADRIAAERLPGFPW